MKHITDVIKMLEELREQHGDLPVYEFDNKNREVTATGQLFDIREPGENLPKRLTIW